MGFPWVSAQGWQKAGFLLFKVWVFGFLGFSSGFLGFCWVFGFLLSFWFFHTFGLKFILKVYKIDDLLIKQINNFKNLIISVKYISKYIFFSKII